MTQDDLASIVGVGRVMVARWESGQATPSAENLDKLAEVFKINVWELCTPAEIAKTQYDIEDCFLRVMDYTRDKIIEDLQRLGKNSRLNVTPVGNDADPKKDVG